MKSFIISKLIRFHPALQLPYGVKVYTDSSITLKRSIPDICLFKENMRLPDFVPKVGWTVIDIGAYVGIYTLVAARLIGARGEILAFEPNPQAFYWLVNNICLNKFSNVIPVEAAVADYEGNDVLMIPERDILGSSLLNQHLRNLGERTASTYKVIVTTLDSVLESYRLSHVDLLKIDAEGSEILVLSGARRSLQNRMIDKIVIEVHKTVNDPSVVISMLENHRYDIVGRVEYATTHMLYARLAR